MADSNEPKDETVRIELPPQSVPKPPGSDTKSRETVRIQLGPRQSPDKLPLQPPAEPSPDSKSTAQVLTSPEVFSSPSASPAFSADPLPVAQTPAPGGFSSSLKKETARIPRTPDPPSKPPPTVQMKKTQPLIAMPHAAPQRASIAMAPAEKSVMPLCWVLLGVSAMILIIQIWTYFS